MRNVVNIWYHCSMIGWLRNSKFNNLFWGWMALYMLNICVDAPDPYPGSMAEDLSFNEQESVIELVVEKGLGYEDAIPEQEDHDSQQETTLIKGLAIDHFILPSLEAEFYSRSGIEKEKGFTIYFAFPQVHYLEISSPPPEA